LPTTIIGAATLRDADGLALSSRNAYLTADERPIAGRLNIILSALTKAVAKGEPLAQAEARAREGLLSAGFQSVDYIEVRHADDLSRPGPGPLDSRPARALAAAWLGKTRLIDNMAV
jgi:pantoate--beta-alanine ligase